MQGGEGWGRDGKHQGTASARNPPFLSLVVTTALRGAQQRLVFSRLLWSRMQAGLGVPTSDRLLPRQRWVAVTMPLPWDGRASRCTEAALSPLLLWQCRQCPQSPMCYRLGVCGAVGLGVGPCGRPLRHWSRTSKGLWYPLWPSLCFLTCELSGWLCHKPLL